MRVKVYLGDAYFVSPDDNTYHVAVYREGEKLKKGIAYIKGDTVYPYRGKYPEGTMPRTGVYKSGSDYVFVDEGNIGYSIERVVELNAESIMSRLTTKPEDFYNPVDVEIINNNAEIYVPTIKDDDDFLKYLIKSIIIRKKINLRNYKDKFPNEYALNNMKSSLNRSTKMTVTNFKAWCEILGIRWEIAVSDNGTDKISPMPGSITIDSDEF